MNAMLKRLLLLLFAASLMANNIMASYHLLVADGDGENIESEVSYLARSRSRRSMMSKADLIDSFVHESEGSGQDIIEVSEEHTLQFLVKNTDQETPARTTIQDVIPGNAILTDFTIHDEGNAYKYDTRNGKHKERVLEEYQKAVRDGRSAVMLGDVESVNSRCTDCKSGYDDAQQTTTDINIAPGDVLSISISYVTPVTMDSSENEKTSFRTDVTIEVQYPADHFCGIIMSPDYPDYYPNDADNTWLITVPSPLVINATILGIQTEACCDYLYAYDGTSDTDPQLAALSGSKAQGNSVITGGPSMFVKFQSDQTVSGGGFALQFCTVTPHIGDSDDSLKTPINETYTIYETQGTISSPGYPFGYPPSSVMTWIITTAVDEYLVLDTIDLDMLAGETLEIYDDLTGDILCSVTKGDGPYVTTKASGNKVLVVFKTVKKLIWSPRGILLRYYSEQAIFYSCLDEITVSPGDTEWKAISSPNYPSNYENNADCKWIITGQDSVIQIEVEYINLESVYDTLLIYDGNETDSSKVLATLSGSGGQKLEYLTTQNNATILFVSDSSVTYPGFQIKYRAYNAYRGCSSSTTTLTWTEGIIVNPYYPSGVYWSNNCEWLISVPQGYLLDVYVIYDGNNNYLYIYDGESSSSTRLFYDDDADLRYGISVQSSSNKMLVRIDKSNNNWITYFIRYTSFKASDDTTCKSQYVLTDMPGVIKSPNYPRYFTNHTTCEWLIQAPPGETVMVYVDIMTLSSDDMVVFYDGSQSNYIIRQCTSSPYCSEGTWITSSSSSMLVRMTSGTPNGYFKLKFDSSDDYSTSGLIYEYDEYTGYALSPYFPTNYPNRDRTFSISVASGLIHFQFDYFETEECCDHLTLYDGSSKSSPNIAFLSGDNTGYSGQTSGSSLTMYFETDSDGTGNYVGFKMSYCEASRCSSQLPSTIDRNAYSYSAMTSTDPSKYLFSPGSLGQYPVNSDFYWYVECTNNYNVLFYFYHMDLDNSDFIQIYSGFGVDSSNYRAYLSDNENFYTYYATNVNSAAATVWFHSGPYFTGDGFIGVYYC